jgi:Domain of unknown function (DUF4261)
MAREVDQVAKAMIPLGPKPRISPKAIKADLLAHWQDIGDLGVATKPNKKTLVFDIGLRAQAVLTMVKACIPWSELKKPCDASVLWKHALVDLKDHKAFLVVSIKDRSPLSPLERSELLTQLTTSVLKTCPVALGVLWCNASLLIPSALFCDYTLKVLPLGPPIPIWVDIHIRPTAQGRMSGLTTGLNALGHMEIETANSPESAAELRTRFEGLVAYLLKNGPVIGDGDTIGEGADEKIKVVYSSSSMGKIGTVMRIDFDSTNSSDALVG